MSWITIAESDVITKLSGPEIAAMKTAALQAAQSNPLPEVIAQVVKEIRGNVAACERNTLGDGATIPDELLGAAISRIRYELATRLPVASLLTEDRRAANRDALRLLERVAECKFLLVQPTTPTTDEIATPSPSITSRTRNFDRCSQDGI